MNERALRVRVNAALAILFTRDLFLLEHGTGERAIVAKLASYMTPLFRYYDVDVEYNRQGLDPRKSKELTLGPECRGGGKKKVYPDIIVHRRGIQHCHNLLVVEVKRSLNREPRTYDRRTYESEPETFPFPEHWTVIDFSKYYGWSKFCRVAGN